MTNPETVPTPRKMNRFPVVTEDLVRRVSRPVLGAEADAALVNMPEQGVNNRTAFIQPRAGAPLVVKFRPFSGPGRRVAGPQWPRYTRELFGPMPNGDLATLPAVCDVLERHGTLRTPRVVAYDDTLDVVPGPYIISEYVAGATFDWVRPLVEGRASEELGEHLGRLHAGTARVDGYGIFETPRAFPREAWWPRFSRAYRTILRELGRCSERVAGLRPRLLEALRNAVESGAPETFALICIDQSPKHYLRSDDGGIRAMVDVEGHLWAPPEYELAMTLIWLRDAGLFRQAYEQGSPWPRVMDRVRLAYTSMTWMEWAYCSRTLLHDVAGADHAERQLESLYEGELPSAG